MRSPGLTILSDFPMSPQKTHWSMKCSPSQQTNVGLMWHMARHMVLLHFSSFHVFGYSSNTIYCRYSCSIVLADVIHMPWNLALPSNLHDTIISILSAINWVTVKVDDKLFSWAENYICDWITDYRTLSVTKTEAAPQSQTYGQP